MSAEGIQQILAELQKLNRRGGPTKYGISGAVARLHGWRGDMRDLPEDRSPR